MSLRSWGEDSGGLRSLIEFHFTQFGKTGYGQGVVVVVVQAKYGHYIIDSFRDGVGTERNDLGVAVTTDWYERHVDDASTAQIKLCFTPFFHKQLDFPLAALKQRHETTRYAPLETDVHTLLTLDELVVCYRVGPALICAGKFAHGNERGAFEFEGLGSSQVFFNFHDSHSINWFGAWTLSLRQFSGRDSSRRFVMPKSSNGFESLSLVAEREAKVWGHQLSAD